MDKYTKNCEEVRGRIFALLSERKMSQKELADKLEMSSQTVTDWKKGKSNSFMQNLERIAQALQTTGGWLYSGRGQKDFLDTERAEWILQDQERVKLWEKQLDDEMLEVYFLALEKIMLNQGITRSDFFEILQGRVPSEEKVQKIAFLLGITTSELLGEEKKPALVSGGGRDLELWNLIQRIPEDRMPEVERYLRFQAEQGETP